MKRINITVEDELHKLLIDFSKTSGASLSSVIGQLLRESSQEFVKLTKVFEELKKKPQEALEEFQDMLIKKNAQASQMPIELAQDRKRLRKQGAGRPPKDKK